MAFAFFNFDCNGWNPCLGLVVILPSGSSCDEVSQSRAVWTSESGRFKSAVAPERAIYPSVMKAHMA